jgi:hypothetical protein
VKWFNEELSSGQRHGSVDYSAKVALRLLIARAEPFGNFRRYSVAIIETKMVIEADGG